MSVNLYYLAVVFSAYLLLKRVKVYMYCAFYLHVHYVVPTKKNVRNSLNAALEGEALFHDLNPFDYFLWAYLKSLVFETPMVTDMELVARIVAAYDIIQNTIRDICQSAAESCMSMSCLH